MRCDDCFSCSIVWLPENWKLELSSPDALHIRIKAVSSRQDGLPLYVGKQSVPLGVPTLVNSSTHNLCGHLVCRAFVPRFCDMYYGVNLLDWGYWFHRGWSDRPVAQWWCGQPSFCRHFPYFLRCWDWECASLFASSLPLSMGLGLLFVIATL